MTLKEIYPKILLLASRYDMACDYIVSQLIKLGTTYLRLNSEDLHLYKLNLKPVESELHGFTSEFSFHIFRNQLNSVFFRRPVYFRDSGINRTDYQKFSIIHWGAFIRNLMVFDKCKWINHPQSTYLAEHKAFQLLLASRVGFKIPKTVICNNVDYLRDMCFTGHEYAIKGVDTILIQNSLNETFGYTTILPIQKLNYSNMKNAPVVVQEPFHNKLDIRVTIIGDKYFAAAITANSKPINGDWRLQKNNAKFDSLELPSQIGKLCITLTQKLGLRYSAIDLVQHENQYYFLEINPTGEWAWLVDEAGLPIDKAIAEELNKK